MTQNPNNFFDKATDQLKVLKSRLGPMPTNHSIEKTNFTPIFLVGFPRSGTTLLDTILRTHSDIDVVEEQSSLEVAKMFKTKIKFLPARPGERYASALTSMNLSNKVYKLFGSIKLEDYLKNQINNR